MDEHVCQRLLALNQEFYAAIAPHFDQTRQGFTPGLLRLLAYLPTERNQINDQSTVESISVLDVGCGNGRFARILDHSQRPAVYVGVDGSDELLRIANQSSRSMVAVKAHFYSTNLAEQAWPDVLPMKRRKFDFSLCTATLQHLPSYEMRLNVVRQMAKMTQGPISISGWQFLTSERLRRKLLPWSDIGLRQEDVEPGDALLPWKQGLYAIRYVHQLDEDEMHQLATDAGLEILEIFRADGHEGDLNLYAVLESAE